MSTVRPLLLSLSLVASLANAKEECALPALKDRARNHPECLFYTGTKHFRDQEYSSAFDNWQLLVDLPELPLDEEHLRTDAQNNLGYLHYMGWGTPQFHAKAIEFWQTAYKAGHHESAYHLCHAFGDAREPEFQPKLATSYCREALRRYGQLREQDEQIVEIVNHARRILERVESE